MRAAMPDTFFDKARRFAAAGILLAGLCAVAGSLLEWATIVERDVAQDIDFGAETGEIEAEQGDPFNGVEDRDGRLTLSGGVALVVVAVLLLVRKTSGFAWLAFWISLFVGGIAFADYRALGDVTAGISGRNEVGAEARPGVGLTIVTAAGMLGIISAVGGVAATPRSEA